MSSLSVKNQNQKHVKLEGKQRGRSRSHTPRREKQNSSQKRGKSKSRVKGPTPDDLRIARDAREQSKNASNAYKGGLSTLDLTKARACHERLLKGHARAAAAKLPVWDHMKRVVLESDAKKTRFQMLAEWKATIPKPSLLTQAIQCSHEWVLVGQNAYGLEYGKSRCNKCNVLATELKDEKTSGIINEQLQELYDSVCQDWENLRGMFRAGNGNRPMETHLVLDEVVTSATNAVLNPAFRIRPSDASTEYNFFAGLFDEYKCIRSHFDFFIQRNTSPTTVSATPAYCCAYDPVDSTVYTAVASALVAAQKIGPIQCNLTGAVPVPYTRSGFWRFDVVMPKGPQIEVASAASPVATGCWQDCQITAADYGYYKSIAPALGSSVQVSLWGYIDMTVLFRCRT